MKIKYDIYLNNNFLIGRCSGLIPRIGDSIIEIVNSIYNTVTIKKIVWDMYDREIYIETE